MHGNGQIVAVEFVCEGARQGRSSLYVERSDRYQTKVQAIAICGWTEQARPLGRRCSAGFTKRAHRNSCRWQAVNGGGVCNAPKMLDRVLMEHHRIIHSTARNHVFIAESHLRCLLMRISQRSVTPVPRRQRLGSRPMVSAVKHEPQQLRRKAVVLAP